MIAINYVLQKACKTNQSIIINHRACRKQDYQYVTKDNENFERHKNIHKI